MTSDNITLTYLGQCGFCIEAGVSKLVTDPYLSFSVDENHYSMETPWKRLYPPPCTLSELSPDYILISHEHDDHLDPDTIREYISHGGNAVFIAPSPICFMLTKLGVKNIVAARAEKTLYLTDFQIMPIPCAHTELHLDRNGDFFELSYIIKFADKSIFFGGDMSMYDGLTDRLSRETLSLLLLPCNGGDKQRTAKGIIGNINEVEASELSAKLKTPFVPMHHDLYEINGCSDEKILSAAKEADTSVIFCPVGKSLIL